MHVYETYCNFLSFIIQVNNFIVFVGIEFYHRSNKTNKAELETMIKSARDHNLGEYLDTGLGITYVDHTDCTYPYEKEKKKKQYHN